MPLPDFMQPLVGTLYQLIDQAKRTPVKRFRGIVAPAAEKRKERARKRAKSRLLRRQAVRPNKRKAIWPDDGLNDALRQHGVGDFHETGDVGALNVVGMLIVAAVLDTGVVDVQHNVMQTGVHFLGFPAQPRGVLRHSSPDVATPPALAALPAQTVRPLQGRDRSLQSWLAYLPLPPRLYAIGNQYARGVNVQFVLRRAWQGDIHRYARGCWPSR